MKIVVLIARILLGIMFVVFGANGFLHFIPMKGEMPGVAGQFTSAMMTSHFIYAGFALQLIGGVLLLSGFYVPLALTLLGPVLGFILLFHATMAPGGIGPGLLATVLWFIVFAGVRRAFAGIFAQKVVVE
jgi:putative oxidoreductase